VNILRGLVICDGRFWHPVPGCRTLATVDRGSPLRFDPRLPSVIPPGCAAAPPHRARCWPASSAFPLTTLRVVRRQRGCSYHQAHPECTTTGARTVEGDVGSAGAHPGGMKEGSRGSKRSETPGPRRRAPASRRDARRLLRQGARMFLAPRSGVQDPRHCRPGGRRCALTPGF